MRPLFQNRQEFDDGVSEAIPKIKQLIADVGADPVLVSVLRQLEAIQQWTANGQDVTPDQNKKLILGLQALREMADFTDEQELVVRIDNYIKTVMVPYEP
jgi:hypothetical protein